MEHSGKDFDAYIQKILAIQQAEEEQALQDDDLHQIAADLGFSESDWQAIQTTFQDHVSRGRGYLQYKNWDDAIAELEEALILHPYHPDVLSDVASAYEQRWLQLQDEADQHQALRYARKCLNIVPTHAESLRLISRIKSGTARPARTRRTLIFAAAALLLILIGAGWWVYSSLSDAPQPDRIAKEAPQEDTSQSQNAISVTDGLGVPVRILQDANAEGLLFDIEQAEYSVYSPSSSYNVLVNITLQGIEVRRLEVKSEFIGQDGQVAATKIAPVVRDSDPVHRSGDTAPLRILHYARNEILPELKEVVLSVSTISKQPVPASYEPSPLIPVKWANKPSNIELELRERLRNLSQKGNLFSKNATEDGQPELRHEIVLEVKNTGTVSLARLELEIQYLNSRGELIELAPPLINLSQTSDEKIYAKTGYVCTRSDPTFLPGQTRLLRALSTLRQTPLKDVKEYSVTVIDVE